MDQRTSGPKDQKRANMPGPGGGHDQWCHLLAIDLQLTTTTAAQHRAVSLRNVAYVAISFMCIRTKFEMGLTLKFKFFTFKLINRLFFFTELESLRTSGPVCVVAAAAAGPHISNQAEFHQITNHFTAIPAPRGPTADESFHGRCKRKRLAGRFPDRIQSGQMGNRYVVEISPPYARAVNGNRGTFGGAFTF